MINLKLKQQIDKFSPQQSIVEKLCRDFMTSASILGRIQSTSKQEIQKNLEIQENVYSQSQENKDKLTKAEVNKENESDKIQYKDVVNVKTCDKQSEQSNNQQTINQQESNEQNHYSSSDDDDYESDDEDDEQRDNSFFSDSDSYDNDDQHMQTNLTNQFENRPFNSPEFNSQPKGQIWEFLGQKSQIMKKMKESKEKSKQNIVGKSAKSQFYQIKKIEKPQINETKETNTENTKKNMLAERYLMKGKTINSGVQDSNPFFSQK